MKTAADAWAITASSLPLAFSQVREDPRLDLEVARRLPADARVMMIASGGETAVCLARLPLAELILVDVNPAQLALSRCRFHLAENFAPSHSMSLLGHLPMESDARLQRWAAIFSELGLPGNILAEPSQLAELGADHCGRYEATFRELRRLLTPCHEEVTRFLQTSDPETASRIIAPGTVTGNALEAAFAQALRLENLVALFGEEATRNPRQPFHTHFINQLRDITSRQAPSENPWIWQLLAGKFPPSTPVDWLQGRSNILARPTYQHASMLDALCSTTAASLDFIQLSNILDWLSPEAASDTLAAAHRALRQGGFIIIRQLNSSLHIPSLCPALTWHLVEGRRLQLADRSFFYPKILLASRP
jgi:S-adenosylmethionine-diacylglycerol 3-amino-3-carboxypropyl transferase